ncbi:hypothetical protein KSP39_PZI004213 [Platanthera zijinensis]|uniref:Uncharacterized protein n=1 Tax=Platanthera zijinensis TaxID=2320716 RepID=A0AAP0BYA9_9ASPA
MVIHAWQRLNMNGSQIFATSVVSLAIPVKCALASLKTHFVIRGIIRHLGLGCERQRQRPALLILRIVWNHSSFLPHLISYRHPIHRRHPSPPRYTHL